MHFHLPKPLHGWREFVGEVGIIVVGVLIALAGEQFVESLHWQEKAGQARDAMTQEIVNNYEAAVERIVETPCLNAQLDVLERRVLAEGDRLEPAPRFETPSGPSTYAHSSRLWNDAIWQSVISEQVGSHLGEAERQELAVAYGSVEKNRELNRSENDADGSFLALSFPLQLDAGVRAHFIEVIESERKRAATMRLLAGQQIGRWKAIRPNVDRLAGEDRSRATAITVPEWCRAHGFPLAPAPH
jgi:hypothetical protein